MTLQEKVNRLSLIGLEWMGPDEQYLLGDAYANLPDIEPMTDDEFEVFFQDIAPKVPTVIDNSITLIRQGSAVLRSHEMRAAKALQVVRKLETAWEEAYAIQEPAKKWEALASIDTRTEKFLVNGRDALKQMKEGRAALTQLLTRITSMYTAQENLLDPAAKEGIAVKGLQTRRNKYVQDVAIEKKRLADEAQKAKEKTQAAVDFRAAVVLYINTTLINYQAGIKAKWLTAFNEITLDNYEEKKTRLQSLETAFKEDQRDKIIPPMKIDRRPNHHTDEEIGIIMLEVWDGFDFPDFYSRYRQEMGEYKKDLQDRLPSKLAELQEAKRLADEAAETRRRAEEAQRKAQEEKNEQARKKLEQEAEERRQEAQRQEEERQRQEEERQQREQEQQRQLAQQQQEQQQQATAQVELAKTAGHAQAAFAFSSATAAATDELRAKSALVIEVLNSVGWVEIFTAWYEREGVKLPMDKWEKKTMGSMKKDMEAIATKAYKDGKTDQISSKNLNYKEDLKATNVREKEEK